MPQTTSTTWDVANEPSPAVRSLQPKEITLYQQVARRLERDERVALLTERFEDCGRRLAFLTSPKGPSTPNFAAELRSTLDARNDLCQRLVHRIEQLVEPALRPYADRILKHLQ